MWKQSFITSRCIYRKISKQWRVWKATLTSTNIFFLLLTMMLYGLKHPFCEFKSAFLVVIPPNPPPTLQSQWEESLMLCKHCSVIAKTLVWYQHYFSPKSKTKHVMRKANPAHTSCLDCSNGNYDGEERVLGQNSLKASTGINWSL